MKSKDIKKSSMKRPKQRAGGRGMTLFKINRNKFSELDLSAKLRGQLR